MDTNQQQPRNQRPTEPPPQGNLPGGPRERIVGQLQCLDGRTLTERQLQDLSRELLGVYAKGFMHSREAVAQRADEFLADLRDHLTSSQRLLIFRDGPLRAVLCGLVVERPARKSYEYCIGLVEYPAEKIYHLGGLLLDPELQRKGIGAYLLSMELENTEATVLSFHTQNRNMVKLAEKVATLCHALSCEMAGQLKPLHRDLDSLSCIDRGRYGGKPLYGDLAKLRSIGIPGLDLDRGDAQFFAGRVKPVTKENSL